MILYFVSATAMVAAAMAMGRIAAFGGYPLAWLHSQCSLASQRWP